MTVVQRQTPNSEQPNLTTSSMKFFHCCSYNGVSAELRAISNVGGGAPGRRQERTDSTKAKIKTSTKLRSIRAPEAAGGSDRAHWTPMLKIFLQLSRH